MVNKFGVMGGMWRTKIKKTTLFCLWRRLPCFVSGNEISRQ